MNEVVNVILACMCVRMYELGPFSLCQLMAVQPERPWVHTTKHAPSGIALPGRIRIPQERGGGRWGGYLSS